MRLVCVVLREAMADCRSRRLKRAATPGACARMPPRLRRGPRACRTLRGERRLRFSAGTPLRRRCPSSFWLQNMVRNRGRIPIRLRRRNRRTRHRSRLRYRHPSPWCYRDCWSWNCLSWKARRSSRSSTCPAYRCRRSGSNRRRWHRRPRGRSAAAGSMPQSRFFPHHHRRARCR